MAPQLNVATELRDGAIFASKLVVGQQTWIHNLVWTATDYNTCEWSSGTIQFSDGTTYDIAAGNTGNMAATTYIYFNQTGVLQVTTDYTQAIGDNNILLAIAKNVSTTTAKCLITPIATQGTTIDGNKIITGKIMSADGLSYFDLDLGLIVVSDASNPRGVMGNVA